jgi:hypothetical protein
VELDLVLELHDGPGAKGKLAQAFAKALADAANARRPDVALEQEQLARRRDTLVRRAAALHEVRQPCDISVYGLQAVLIGTPVSVQSEQHLGTGSGRARGRCLPSGGWTVGMRQRQRAITGRGRRGHPGRAFSVGRDI